MTLLAYIILAWIAASIIWFCGYIIGINFGYRKGINEHGVNNAEFYNDLDQGLRSWIKERDEDSSM